jgi:hypothetical protein
VEDRIFSWGLMAGACLLIAFSTSHGAWWRSAPSPLRRTQPDGVVSGALASNPFAATSEYVPPPQQAPAPIATVPAPASIAPAAIAPAATEREDEPQSAEDGVVQLDYEAMTRARNHGVEHGSRTH